MKVILTKDVAKVGRIGEVKELSDGYARNFIIARGLGLAATAENLARLEAKQQKQLESEKVALDLLQKDLEKLKAKPIVITVRASETGHLFAALHRESILAELQKQSGLRLGAEALVLPQSIKSLGDYEIGVKLGSRLVGNFTLQIRS